MREPDRFFRGIDADSSADENQAGSMPSLHQLTTETAREQHCSVATCAIPCAMTPASRASSARCETIRP